MSYTFPAAARIKQALDDYEYPKQVSEGVNAIVELASKHFAGKKCKSYADLGVVVNDFFIHTVPDGMFFGSWAPQLHDSTIEALNTLAKFPKPKSPSDSGELTTRSCCLIWC